MTEIREPNYSIDLPGEWAPAETAEPGAFAYREIRGTANVTVTLLGVRPMFAIADQQRLLDDYMSHRAKFEQGQAPSLKQEPATSRQEGDSFEGSWAGTDWQTGRRTQHRVLLVNGLLADFLYEATGVEEKAFAEQADAVLGTATASAQ